jgi:hypothetical protein
MSNFDKLIDQIRPEKQYQLKDRFGIDIKNTWQGKICFPINEEIMKYLNISEPVNEETGGINLSSMELKDSLPFKYINELSEDFTDLKGLLKIEFKPELIKHSSLIFLESVHSINRSFNSKKHSNLSLPINKIYQSNEISKEDDKFYQVLVDIYNTNIMNWDGLINPEMSEFTETESLTEKVKFAENNHKSLFDQIKELGENLISGAGNLAKDLMKKIKKLVKNISKFNEENTGKDYKYIPKIATPIKLSAIVPVETVTTPAVVEVLNKITEYILQNFILKTLAELPGDLIPILANTVSSVVSKILNIGSADVVRYIAANLFRTFINLIPNIAHLTGMLAGIWALLLQLAPYLILCAIIVILLIKSKESSLLGGLFVMGETSTDYFLHTYKPTKNLKINKQTDLLYQMKDELSLINDEEFIINYCYGFAVKNNQVTYAIDLEKNIKIPKAIAQLKFDELSEKIINFWSD